MNTRIDRQDSRTLRARGGLAVALLLAAAGPVMAGDWKWTVTPYVWATDLGVDVSVQDREVLDEKVTFTDLLDSVDTTLQVHVETQHRAHGIMLDLFEVELSDDGNRVVLPDPDHTEAVLGSDIGMTILDVGGIYDPRGDRLGFSFLYGARTIDQHATLDAELEVAPATVTKSYEAADTLVDVLFGVRFAANFSRRFSGQLRADVSTGGTRLTWSFGSAITYSLDKRGRYALQLGYRRMDVDFKPDGPLEAQMTLSGFLTGVRFSF